MHTPYHQTISLKIQTERPMKQPKKYSDMNKTLSQNTDHKFMFIQ